jgi:hypothetical protein
MEAGMTRRERRIRHRRVRRVFAGVIALGTVGLGVGFAGGAGAQNFHVNNDGPGAGNYPKFNYNCTGDTWANSGNAQNRGNSGIAC